METSKYTIINISSVVTNTQYVEHARHDHNAKGLVKLGKSLQIAIHKLNH